MATKSKKSDPPTPNIIKSGPIDQILVIPDSHACPEHDNKRATILSELIDVARPDIIVHIGDLFDLSSCCSYDKGSRGAVGRTFKADINSGVDFQEKMFASYEKSKARYKPRRVVLEGNHEHRVHRALDLDPTLVGLMGFADFQFERFFTDVVPYFGATPGHIEIAGIVFAHFLASAMGRALSGINHAHSVLSKMHQSFVVGHSHLFDYKTHVTMSGRRLQGLVSGCYIDPDHDHPYAGKNQMNWHRGVVMLRNVENGSYDFETCSMKRLKELYGG